MGWAQGQHNLARMRGAGPTGPVIWMDVGVYPSRPWSSSTTGNKASSTGCWPPTAPGDEGRGVLHQVAVDLHRRGREVRARRVAHDRLVVAGHGEQGVIPASFNGGPTLLAQWWTTTRDYDVMCPHDATTNAMKAHFRKF